MCELVPSGCLSILQTYVNRSISIMKQLSKNIITCMDLKRFLEKDFLAL